MNADDPYIRRARDAPPEGEIRLIRGLGGQVEVEGPIGPFAELVLRRAGFEAHAALRGWWWRLPFDRGRTWENQQASYAARVLAAAHHPVTLDPSLIATPDRSASRTAAPIPPIRPASQSPRRP